MIADVLVIVTIAGFFGLCVALVKACNLVIGPDEADR